MSLSLSKNERTVIRNDRNTDDCSDDLHNNNNNYSYKSDLVGLILKRVYGRKVTRNEKRLYR